MVDRGRNFDSQFRQNKLRALKIVYILHLRRLNNTNIQSNLINRKFKTLIQTDLIYQKISTSAKN